MRKESMCLKKQKQNKKNWVTSILLSFILINKFQTVKDRQSNWKTVNCVNLIAWSRAARLRASPASLTYKNGRTVRSCRWIKANPYTPNDSTFISCVRAEHTQLKMTVWRHVSTCHHSWALHRKEMPFKVQLVYWKKVLVSHALNPD